MAGSSTCRPSWCNGVGMGRRCFRSRVRMGKYDLVLVSGRRGKGVLHRQEWDTRVGWDGEVAHPALRVKSSR